jgi:hypothetical protein
VESGREALESAWADAGREGLDADLLLPDAKETAHRYIHSYHGQMGEETANMIAESVGTDDETIAGYAQAFEEAGADEVAFFPCSTDVGQVEALSAALGERLG